MIKKLLDVLQVTILNMYTLGAINQDGGQEEDLLLSDFAFLTTFKNCDVTVLFSTDASPMCFSLWHSCLKQFTLNKLDRMSCSNIKLLRAKPLFHVCSAHLG